MKFTTTTILFTSFFTSLFTFAYATSNSHEFSPTARDYNNQIRLISTRGEAEVAPRTTYLDESLSRGLYERVFYGFLANEFASRNEEFMERDYYPALPSREDEDMEDYFARDYRLQQFQTRGIGKVAGKVLGKVATKVAPKLLGKLTGGNSQPGAPKSTGGKILEAAKDTKTAIGLITDGVGLATDIATGDVPKAIFDGIKLTVDGIIAAFHAISSAIEADKYARSGFTQDTVSKLHAAHPQMNFVICHTAHHYKFPGVKGKDWYHDHRELNVKFPIGSTIGYEIYGFIQGEFFREGDGGYLNWAYIGKVLKTEDGGKHVTFGKP